VARRLLFLTERYPPDLGGVAASAARIARSLATLGNQVDLICWTRALDSGRVMQEDGNPAVLRIGRFREWDSTLPHTINLLDWLLSRNRYDLIWGHYLTPAGFVAAMFGKQNALASVVSIRGNDLDREMFPPGDFSRVEWTLRNATLVTSVTGALAAKAAAISGRTDTVLLRNVVDSSVFRPTGEDLGALRQALGIGSEEAVLGFSGELREKKGMQPLLAALQQVRTQRPACLLVIGEVRPSEVPRLLMLLGAGSLEEHRIVVTGQLTDPQEVNRHLQLCDVYLQPSLWDGMPNALLEAMAAGRGCIASDAGGIPEVLTSGVEGVVLLRWQLHRLGDAVLEWLGADTSSRQRIQQAARERMRIHFHEEGERHSLQALLDRIKSS
jgi:glycosyltransferase involved in cell wall biosynthesis